MKMPTRERRTYKLIKARQEFKRRRGYRCHYCGRRPKSKAARRFWDVHKPGGGFHAMPGKTCVVACKWCHGLRSQGKKTTRRKQRANG